RRAGPHDGGRAERAGGARPDRRAPQLPDALRPRHGGAGHQPPGGQRPQGRRAAAGAGHPPAARDVGGQMKGAPTRPGPVAAAERIVPLDVLRGAALLGILLMNIRGFAAIGAAYEIPTVYGDLREANYAVWYLTSLLADSKFMAIFSMLFGAGMVLMAGRYEAAGRRPLALHLRRMAVLLLFGLAHAYLLWVGDILYTY